MEIEYHQPQDEKAFSYKGEGADKLFKKIDFAVLDNARNHYYNFEQFSKYFG